MSGWRCPNCGSIAEGEMSIYREGEIFNTHSQKVGPWCLRCGERVLFDGDGAPLEGSSPGVLLISGTCASGKSTLSHLISQTYGAVQIDGDWYLHLRKAESDRKLDYTEIDAEMCAMAGGFVSMGKAVVIAHVILPGALSVYHNYFTAKHIPYRMVVLMPSEVSVLERNRTRICWAKTTPEYWVKKFYDDLSAGDADFQAFFYDSTDESPEETARRLWEKFSPGNVAGRITISTSL